MRSFTKIAELRQALDEARAGGKTIGMVGTSGAMHEGHLSLLKRASEENDIAVLAWMGALSVDWMNSAHSYPRDFERDIKLAETVGLDWLYLPEMSDLYPGQPMTQIKMPGMCQAQELMEKPQHVDNILLSMAMLFNVFQPAKHYSGEKDWHQLAMFTRLAEDLHYRLEVIGCETIRDPDGVAKSSRNMKLSPDERSRAPALYKALSAAAQAIEGGERSAQKVRDIVTKIASEAGSLDYIVVVDAKTMEPLETLKGDVRLVAALKLGETSIVDNLGASVG